MASQTDIANLALSLIGESAISSINDPSDKPSRICLVNYAQALDETLSLARWSFAKKQVGLSKLTDAPLFKWTAAFQLPSDFIRLCEVEGVDAFYPKEFFDIQGRKLFCGLDSDNEEDESLHIEYIRREDDPTLYSPLFVEALAYRLAIKISVPLTNSDAKARTLMQTFEQVILPRCMTIDAQQRYSGENHPLRKFLRRSPLIKSRQGGSDLELGSMPPGSGAPIANDASDLDGIFESEL